VARYGPLGWENQDLPENPQNAGRKEKKEKRKGNDGAKCAQIARILSRYPRLSTCKGLFVEKEGSRGLIQLT